MLYRLGVADWGLQCLGLAFIRLDDALGRERCCFLAGVMYSSIRVKDSLVRESAQKHLIGSERVERHSFESWLQS